MKNLKKLEALVLAVMMMLSIIAVSASGDVTQPGSITINKIVLDEEGTVESTYSLYKLLNLESYNKDSKAYSYTVNAEWEGFFATAEAQQYFIVDASDYVTWIGGDNAEASAAFAKLALAYAKNNGINPVKTTNDTEGFELGTNDEGDPFGKFTGLELGYYLVDSTLGALCGLTTTNPDAYINAKNGKPTIDKQVKEDSTSQWADSNTADVGQTVEFRTTINVHAGAENYVLHDKMSEGLTFGQVTSIEHVVPGKQNHTVETTKYTVVTEGLTDECTFEVRFSKEVCDELETNDKLIVSYTAVVNENAIIADKGNPNESWLDFGENNNTTHDSTQTYTYGFEIIKTDSQNDMINGAKFKVYDAETDGNEIPVIFDEELGCYRRAVGEEVGEEIVVTDGIMKVVGFDNGTYYLEETVAPAGYNKLAARVKFIISDGNLYGTFNDGVYSAGSGVHVVNKTGNMLPETGGIGTTLFYIVGGVLVVGAVVMLITKKRMSSAE